MTARPGTVRRSVPRRATDAALFVVGLLAGAVLVLAATGLALAIGAAG